MVSAIWCDTKNSKTNTKQIVKNAKFLLSTLFAAAALTAVNAMAADDVTYTTDTDVTITEDNTDYGQVTVGSTGEGSTSVKVTYTLGTGLGSETINADSLILYADSTVDIGTGLDFDATLSYLYGGTISGEGKFETVLATVDVAAGNTLEIKVSDADITRLNNSGSGDVVISSSTTEISRLNNSGSGTVTISSASANISRITNSGTGSIVITSSNVDVEGNDYDGDDNGNIKSSSQTVASEISTTGGGSITITSENGVVKASTITSSGEVGGAITISAVSAEIGTVSSLSTGNISITNTYSGEGDSPDFTITSVSSSGSGHITISGTKAAIGTVTSSGSGDILIKTSNTTVTTVDSAGGNIHVSGTASITTINVTGDGVTDDDGVVMINSGAEVTVGNFTDTSYSANLQVAGSMEVSGSMTFSSGETSTITVSEGGSLTVATFTDSGSGAISFDVAEGGSLEITTLNLGTPGVQDTSSNESITFSGAGNYMIGTISANSLNSNNPRTLTVDVGTTLNVGTLAISSKLTTLAIGGTVNVLADETSGYTGAITFGTGYATDITNVEGSEGKLTADSLAHSGTGSMTISVSELEIGDVTHSGSGSLAISSDKATIGTIDASGGALTISSADATITSLSYGSTSALTISSAKASIGTIETTSSDAGELAISSADVTIGNLTYAGTGGLRITNSGSFTVTGTLSFTVTHSFEISAETVNIGELVLEGGFNVGSITATKELAIGKLTAGFTNSVDLTISTPSGTIGELDLTGTKDVIISEGSTVAIGTFDGSGTGALTVNGTVTIDTVSGSATINGTGIVNTTDIKITTSGNVISTGGMSINSLTVTEDGSLEMSATNLSIGVSTSEGSGDVESTDGDSDATYAVYHKSNGALTISVANTGEIGAVINEGGDLTISTGANATTTIESITSSTDDAGTLTTSGNGSLTVTSMDLSGETKTQLGGSSLEVTTLNFTAGHSLNISAATAKIETLTLASSWDTGVSTFNSSDKLTIGTLNLTSGYLTVASGGTGNVEITNLVRSGDSVNTVLTVHDGGSLDIDTLTLNTTASTTIDVSGDFSVKSIAIGEDATGLLTFSGNSLTIDSESTTVSGDLYLAYAGSAEANTLTLSGLSGKELHLLGGGVTITSDTSFGTFVRNGSAETITTNGTLTIGEGATASFDLMEVNAAHALDIAGDGKLSADTLSVLGSGSFKIESGSFEVETFTAGNTGEMTLASSGSIDTLQFLGGTINVDADVSIGVLSRSNIDNADSMTANGNVVIASGSTLTISDSATISSSYTTSISGEGTLSAEKEFTIAGSSAVDISTSSVEIGTLSHSSNVATITSAVGTIDSLTNDSGTLTIGSQDATTDYTIKSITQTGGTLKIYATTLKTDEMTGTSAINLGNTTISLATKDEATFDARLWLETGTTPTFDVSAGQDLTLSGIIGGQSNSGTGTLVKTGEGKLTLSGSNTYYGGTTISAGTLVAGSSGALGYGKVTIASGAKLEISSSAEISNELAITLGVANMKTTATSSIAVARADGGDYVINGDGVLTSTAITISVDEAVLSVIADGAESYDFYVVNASTLKDWDDSGVSITLSSELISAGYTVATMANGILTICVPEPSMFGVLAGLGALALVATRRRRSRKAA